MRRRKPNPAELVVMGANPAELVVLGANPQSGGQLEQATQMCEDFRGSPCDYVDHIEEPSPRAMTLAQLGKLQQLEVKRPTGWKWGELDFSQKDVIVTANPTGTQIYFIGGDQRISRGQLTYLGADNSKELIDLGETMLIAYRANKAHVNGIASDYGHNFGERTGVRPRLMYDRRGPQPRLFLVGGEYIAKIEGIDN